MARALAQWRSMRRLSVSRPCRNMNALKGLITGPRSRIVSTRAFMMKAKLPIVSAKRMPR